ncbi:unnamed protein product [Penicillium egyptiacum]|uniref:Aminoglycoside phosphotransferase domain-containing protein n=1 Tax=Penicillium egyptiacum TaxID=1303716 RepID=A0A9W4K7K8_9EURO|nr:unnamed protein product [Penicillium egyptiacum]
MPANSHDVRLIHEGGTLSAVWAIGNNAICKVHRWSSDTTSESKTIKFIQGKAHQVPVPEVVYSWEDGNRSFWVLKRVPDITLREAWGTMSATEQASILDEVVSICDILASVTSERLQNVYGGPVLEPYLAHSGQDSLEPLTVSESRRYFFREDLRPNPEIEGRFHLYHPDLGPGNILVSSQSQRLSAIIDWECAGVLPTFLDCNKAFCVSGPGLPSANSRYRWKVNGESDSE